jgi:hypothetical protein
VEYVREAKKRKLVNSILAKIETQCDLGMSLYDYAYESAMERILAQTRDTRVLALEALAWITHAQRPLTSLELEHALAIETDLDIHEFDEQNIVPREEIISCCAGLITEDSESGTIRLVHYTTQKYLERKLTTLPDAPAPNPEYAISIKCLRYLSFDALVSGPCAETDEIDQRLECHPFLHYAASYWAVHIRCSENHDHTLEDDHRMTEIAVLFLNRPELVESAVQAELWRRPWSKKGYQGTCVPQLLAESGVLRLFRSLIARGLDMDSRDECGQTPLTRAVENGHAQLVEMLLAKEADVNTRNHIAETPLLLAIRLGHTKVAELLLARDDIDVNCVGRDGRSALYIAASKSHVAIVELLLANEAIDVNLRRGQDETALSHAVKAGKTEIVKLILAKEAVDVNTRDIWGRTPLMQAVVNDRIAIVQILLARVDVDVSLADNRRNSPLSLAAGKGIIAMVRLPLATETVDVN